MKNKIYIIDGKTYLIHINDEVHLYGLLHQLAFLAGRIDQGRGGRVPCAGHGEAVR